jgi:hypothetical protein
MNAPRIRTLRVWLVLLAALLLACASTGPPRVWTEFPATYSAFLHYFDRRGEDLDPIEGIWSQDRLWTEFAIVRDSTFEGYDYVGVRFHSPGTGGLIIVRGVSDEYPDSSIADTVRIQDRPKGVIFIALRCVEGVPGVYEYTDGKVLRGEKCSDEPCHGVYVITADGRLIRQRFAIEVYQPGDGWTRKYPPQ